MIEYLPWSYSELNTTLEYYKNKLFTILDIELGGDCNLSCIYCDTPDRNTVSKISIKYINTILSRNNIKWLFICGLGEPTVSQNKKKLIEILNMCKELSVKCSIFTNIVILDEDIKRFIDDEVLYILFKLDSFNPDIITRLFNSNNPKSILRNIDEVKDLVKCNKGVTNIAASIVPTTVNYNELPSLIDFCFQNNIFPMIGDLENSGRSIKKYKKLKISSSELYKIRDYIKSSTGSTYKVPICPSVIGGIHIDHDNNLIVDDYTGLSCHWFWLKEPKPKILANTNNSMAYEELCRRIIDYRHSKLSFVKKHVKEIQELPFGGCGGDIKCMLSKYIGTTTQ